MADTVTMVVAAETGIRPNPRWLHQTKPLEPNIEMFAFLYELWCVCVQFWQSEPSNWYDSV